jgi:hypothetical protein
MALPEESAQARVSEGVVFPVTAIDDTIGIEKESFAIAKPEFLYFKGGSIQQADGKASTPQAL